MVARFQKQLSQARDARQKAEADPEGDPLGKDIQRAQEAFQKQQALAKSMEGDVSAGELRAPVAGTVLEVAVKPQQRVEANAVWGTLAAIDSLKAKAVVPAHDANDIAAGQAVTLSCDGKRWGASVAEVSVPIQQRASKQRSVEVTVDVPNPQHLRKPGDRGELELSLGTRSLAGRLLSRGGSQ
jgi:biotin carboxyl carrier protein